MKIIKPGAEYFEKTEDPLQFIERCGRVCYKSEDLITETSAKKFVEGLINRKHFAMLEHSNLIVQCSPSLYSAMKEELDTTYLSFTEDGINYIFSGSFRAWYEAIENHLWTINRNCSFGVSDILLCLFLKNPKVSMIFEPIIRENFNVDISAFLVDKGSYYKELPIHIVDEDFVKKVYVGKENLIMKHIRHTIRFVCDRGVSHEIVRHRPCGFAQESTRYCNYSKDKFNEEITVIEPLFFERGSEKYNKWKRICSHCETHYFELLDMGATPQEARSVLPNSLKTEIIVTATEIEWEHIIDLRYHGTTGTPHPQMLEVMKLAYPQLCEKSEYRLG